MTELAAVLAETQRQVAALFAGANEARIGPGADPAPPLIGLEAEFLVMDDAAGGTGVVGVDRLEAILGADPTLARRVGLSFEPGGQIELSPAPEVSVALATARVRASAAELSARLRQHAIRIEAVGVDQRRGPDDIGLQLRRDRYIAMQRHFDAIGPAGRRMMRQTASLQVCVDLAPGGEGARQWLAANLVGPTLAALFRSTSGLDHRTRIWLGVDPSRTGLDGRQVDVRRPVDAYLGFALGAEVMLLPGHGRTTDAAPLRMPFATWAGRANHRVGVADVAFHLSTLFPPVRPRGRYLEVRYLDAQPPERLDVAVTLVAILLADREARGAAIEICANDPTRLGEEWLRSADRALADPLLRDRAKQLVGVARARVQAIAGRWPSWLPAAADQTLCALESDLGSPIPMALSAA